MQLDRLLVRVLFLAATVLPGAVAAQAPQLSVEPRGCKGVHLVAHQASVSAVLAELGKQLKFQLHDQAGETRTVDLDETAPAPELVAKLMAGGNVVTDDAPDPKCPGQVRLTRVWLLPRGEDAPPAPPPQPAMTPMEVYRKAHGLPPEDKDSAPARKPDRGGPER